MSGAGRSSAVAPWAGCLVLVLAGCASILVPSREEYELPSQREYLPPGGRGRVVVLVSGYDGPGSYTRLAQDMADQGYYVVLVAGNDLWNGNNPTWNGGEALLRGVIMRAGESPHALPGKVGVVGCSRGGATALAYAAQMPDLVAAVVAQYPVTSFIKDPAAFVGTIRAPVLILAGTADQNPRCPIREARALDMAAKASPAPDLLRLHEYPRVGHGFSSDNRNRQGVYSDALNRTLSHLRRYLGDS